MVRLGRISYVNMAPVFYRVEAEVEEVQGVPTDLNRMLIEGELDTAPISSIEYARNADKVARIYERLGTRVVLSATESEITAVFVALGLMLSIGAAGFSLLRSFRPG